jgi:hypothetical protein
MSSPRKSLAETLTGFPAAGIAWGMAAALVLGAVCGLLHAPFAIVVVLGLAAAAVSLRLEWRALTAGPDGARRPNIGVQLVAAGVFLALVAIGLVSLGDFVVHAMRR